MLIKIHNYTIKREDFIVRKFFLNFKIVGLCFLFLFYVQAIIFCFLQKFWSMKIEKFFKSFLQISLRSTDLSQFFFFWAFNVSFDNSEMGTIVAPTHWVVSRIPAAPWGPGVRLQKQQSAGFMK